MQYMKNILPFYNPSTKVWSGLPKASPFNPYQNVADLVFEVLKRNADKVLQICADSGVELTGADLLVRSIRIAQNLVKMGYGGSTENIITMAVRNGEHSAPTVFACLALGIPLNTLSPNFLRDDLSDMLSTVQPKLVFCDSEALEEMLAACQMTKITPKIILFGARVDDFDHIDNLLQPTGREESFSPIYISRPAEHLAVLICSSGTTGRSKAVCFSHSLCIAVVANVFECHPTDRTFAFSTLYWLSGLFMLLTTTLWGATRIITREAFNPDLAVDIVERFRVSVTMMPPSQMSAVTQSPKATSSALSSLRLALCGGTAVSPFLKNSVEKLLQGRPLQVLYGFTEMATAVTVTKEGVYQDGCVGYPRPGMKMKIVDDNGNALDIGQAGEILTKAQFVFSGYYKNEDAAKDMVDSNGWLHSGDIGWFDKNGLLYVIDRKKDIIVHNNNIVSPSEIESVIQTIPGVVAVCVVGTPTERNELPTALVVRAAYGGPDAAEIMKKVNATLPSYKQLSGGVYFTDKLPMTPSGKVLRRFVKELVIGMSL